MQGSMLLGKLIAVNLYSNALICFQKAEIYNTDCRTLNCHHNLLLMQLYLWEVCGGLITIKKGIIGIETKH